MAGALLASLFAAGAAVSPAEPAVPLTAYRSLSACRRALPAAPQLCDPLIFRQAGFVEVGRVDLDGDRRGDLVVRQRSLFQCGSHGCSTIILLAGRSGRLRQADPPLVTAGDLRRCRVAGRWGLRAAGARAPAPCISFR